MSDQYYYYGTGSAAVAGPYTLIDRQEKLVFIKPIHSWSMEVVDPEFFDKNFRLEKDAYQGRDWSSTEDMWPEKVA